MRVFGAMGVPSHYQELKNILRWRMVGADWGWQLPQGPDGSVLLKETIGPFTAAESSFNPVEVLLRAGFPPQRLQVVIMGRATLSAWASWDAWDGRWTDVAKFALAYETTERVRLQAYGLGIPTTVLVYEAIRDNDAETVVARLFERLGVSYRPIAVKGWHRLPGLGHPGSGVVFPEEPAVFMVPGVHARVENADGLVYFSRSLSISCLQTGDVREIARSGVRGIYEGWRLACEKDIRVHVERDGEWDLVRVT